MPGSMLQKKNNPVLWKSNSVEDIFPSHIMKTGVNSNSSNENTDSRKLKIVLGNMRVPLPLAKSKRKPFDARASWK